jgi:hypothetical protein
LLARRQCFRVSKVTQAATVQAPLRTPAVVVVVLAVLAVMQSRPQAATVATGSMLRHLSAAQHYSRLAVAAVAVSQAVRAVRRLVVLAVLMQPVLQRQRTRQAAAVGLGLVQPEAAATAVQASST